MLSNHIPRSAGYDRLSHLPVNACVCIPLCTLFVQTWCIISVIADRVRKEDVISVILCMLYCYVCSPEVIWSSLILPLMSLLCHVFWRRRVFGEWFAWREGSYAFKASLLFLASLSLPLTNNTHTVVLFTFLLTNYSQGSMEKISDPLNWSCRCSFICLL